jgi:hypothetical protein
MTRPTFVTLAPLAFFAVAGCKTSAEPAPAPAASEQSLNIGNGPATKPMAALPAGHSPPPTVAEWTGVPEVTVHHSSSLGCETKMVREWLRVSCTTHEKDNPPQGVEVTRPTGNREFFVFNAAGLASLVMPVRPGVDAEARFTWPKYGARTLKVSWPNGAPTATMQFDKGDK